MLKHKTRVDGQPDIQGIGDVWLSLTDQEKDIWTQMGKIQPKGTDSVPDPPPSSRVELATSMVSGESTKTQLRVPLTFICWNFMNVKVQKMHSPLVIVSSNLDWIVNLDLILVNVLIFYKWLINRTHNSLVKQSIVQQDQVFTEKLKSAFDTDPAMVESLKYMAHGCYFDDRDVMQSRDYGVV